MSESPAAIYIIYVLFHIYFFAVDNIDAFGQAFGGVFEVDVRLDLDALKVIDIDFDVGVTADGVHG